MSSKLTQIKHFQRHQVFECIIINLFDGISVEVQAYKLVQTNKITFAYLADLATFCNINLEIVKIIANFLRQRN